MKRHLRAYSILCGLWLIVLFLTGRDPDLRADQSERHPVVRESDPSMDKILFKSFQDDNVSLWLGYLPSEQQIDKLIRLSFIISDRVPMPFVVADELKSSRKSGKQRSTSEMLGEMVSETKTNFKNIRKQLAEAGFDWQKSRLIQSGMRRVMWDQIMPFNSKEVLNHVLVLQITDGQKEYPVCFPIFYGRGSNKVFLDSFGFVDHVTDAERNLLRELGDWRPWSHPKKSREDVLAILLQRQLTKPEVALWLWGTESSYSEKIWVYKRGYQEKVVVEISFDDNDAVSAISLNGKPVNK